MVLQLVVEEQIEQCDLVIDQLRCGGAGLPFLVGLDRRAGGIGGTAANSQGLVKKAQSRGQVRREAWRVLGVGIRPHKAARLNSCLDIL